MPLDPEAAADAVARVAGAAGFDVRRPALAVVQIAVRTSPTRSGCSRSSAASTRAATRSSRSAAPGRCTPAVSPTALGIERVIVPPHPGLCSALRSRDRPSPRRPRLEPRRQVGPDQRGRVRRRFAACRGARRGAELERDGAAGTPLVTPRDRAAATTSRTTRRRSPSPTSSPASSSTRGRASTGCTARVYGYAFEEEPVELVHCQVTRDRAPPRSAGRRAVEPARPPAAGERGVSARTARRVDAHRAPRAPREARRRARGDRGAPTRRRSCPTGWTAADAAEGCLVLEAGLMAAVDPVRDDRSSATPCATSATRWASR